MESTDGEVNRCSDLSTVGTLTIDAGAWFSDERTTGLLGSDSLVIRIVDTKPVKAARPRPGRPDPPVTVIPRPARKSSRTSPLWEATETALRELPRR